jgi:hypothetical protein
VWHGLNAEAAGSQERTAMTGPTCFASPGDRCVAVAAANAVYCPAGVEFVFRTGFLGEADMAQGILELAQAGCNIIVDDIYYFNEVTACYVICYIACYWFR